MKVELIPMNASHAEIFYQWRQEPIANQYNPLKQLGLDEIREQLKNSVSDLNSPLEEKHYRWIVQSQCDLVGNISLKGVNLMMQTAAIGYAVAQAH